MHRTIPWILALLAAAQPAPAETIDLEAALRLGRERAYAVEAAQLRATAEEARWREARSFRLPVVRLQEIWLRTDSPADAFGLQLNQERFSFADFVAGDPNDPDSLEAATTRLELELPLYTGGEIGTRIDQARLAAEAAGLRVEWTADNAALAAAEALIGLAQAREHEELLARTLATLEEHVDLARAYVDQGMLVRSELLRAEVERSRIEDLRTLAAGRARVASVRLSFLLAVDPETAWELETLPSPAPIAGTLDSWLAGAEARADLAAARSLLAAGRLEIAVRNAGRLPKIGLVARHDLVDDSPFGAHGDSSTIMAVAGIELFGGGRHRHAAAAARAEADAAQREIEQFRQAIGVAVRDAWEQAANARRRHATASAALAAADEALRIVEQRFRQGVVKTIDVLDAMTARREAQMRELVARSETHLSALRLAVASGRRPESVLQLTEDPS